MKPAAPITRLGVAIRERRHDRGQHEAADEIGLPRSTLARIERGAHSPSIDTALALAKWLGWSVEQVIDAARTPVGG
jgi:DNA-binding XRE family transcriptional regulator